MKGPAKSSRQSVGIYIGASSIAMIEAGDQIARILASDKDPQVLVAALDALREIVTIKTPVSVSNCTIGKVS